MPDRRWADPERRPAWLASASVCALLAAAGVFIYTRGAQLSFYVDEWDILLHRRGHGFSVFLDAQHGHLIAVPVLIYKTLFAVFGASSYVPYRLTALAIELTCAGLLFILVRRRLGDAVALAATALVAFLGPAWEPLVSPVGVIALTSLAAGLGTLVALDNRTRRSDIAACALLAVSMASFSYGPAFAAAAAVEIVLRRETRARIWIVLIPTVLYVLWLIGYGQSQIITGDIPNAVRGIADSIGADLVSLTGLYRVAGIPGGPKFDATYGPPLALAFLAVVVFVLVRSPTRTAPRLYGVALLAFAFWLEIALVLGGGRTVTSSRYIYPGVILLLLLSSEMARGRRLGTRSLLALGIAVLGVTVAVNIPNLDQGARALGNLGRFDRAELAALDLARGVAPPAFQPEPLPSPALGHHYLEHIDAASYYSAVDAYGSPAYTLGELLHAPAGPRAAADEVLARAIGLAARPASAAPSGAGCRRLVPAGGSAVAAATVPSGGFFLRAAQPGPLTLRLRRFGDDFGPFAVVLPPIAGTGAVSVSIHRDAAPVPWRVQISGLQRPLVLCPLL